MINTGKKYVISCLVSIIVVLLLIAVINYIFDPFLHYHKPFDWVSYELNNQRYQNNGILKYFDYDALITGNSMTENFKTSEFDDLFGVNSVKVSLSGASYKELWDNINVALESNKDVKKIICSLGIANMLDKWDKMRYELDSYPWYLYDNVFYNDVKYLFNKTTFVRYTINTIDNTIDGKDKTTFDEYSNWNDKFEFSKNAVLRDYKRQSKKSTKQVLTQEEKKNEKENIERNIIKTVKDNPNVDFYLFIPPYSMLYYDNLNQNGKLGKTIDSIEYAVSLLIEYENVHVYSFMNEYNIVTNINNYKDTTHYSGAINSKMLVWMKEGHDLITKDNFNIFMKKTREMYNKFDYDSLFK